ncbi:MAG: hypothetical protein DHS20C15_27260 [Planctomycetota bacterium]|nr:MAG: hypothetical protein DHS20C15_27260 [Planctomycetota bacterium]
MSALALWILGVLIVRALAGPRALGAASCLGLGALLGPGCASLVLVVLLQLSAPGALLGVLWVLAALASLLAWRRRPRAETFTPVAPAAGSRAWLLLPALALASALVITSDHRREVPDGTFDALAIWNLHARALARAEQSPTELLHAMRQIQHPDYPLFLPGAVAAQWRVLGHEAPEIARDTAMLFLLALALLSWAAARRWLPRAPSALLCTLTLLVPLMADKAQGQKADVLMAATFLAAADALVSRAHPRRNARVPAVLAGVLLALLPWAKNEGLVLLGALLVAQAVVRPVRDARSSANTHVGVHEAPRSAAHWWRAAALAALPVLAVVVLHARLWAPADPLVTGLGERMGRQLSDPDRWRAVFDAFVARLSPTESFLNWGSVGTACLIAVLCGVFACRARLARVPRMLGLALLLQLCALVGIYLLTNYPKGVGAHLHTSLDRLLLQLLPVALLFTGLLLRRPHALDAPVHEPSSTLPR